MHRNIFLAFLTLTITLSSIACVGKTAKQRCLEGNTEANPTKYRWVPEQGTTSSYLTPDEVGTCSTVAGGRG